MVTNPTRFGLHVTILEEEETKRTIPFIQAIRTCQENLPQTAKEREWATATSAVSAAIQQIADIISVHKVDVHIHESNISIETEMDFSAP